MCSCDNEVHVSDAGTVFIITLLNCDDILDISTATTKDILFKKPDNVTLLTKTATFTTDGTDGKIQYTSVSGDFDTAGIWKFQAHIITPSGNWHSDIDRFEVFANL